MKISVIVSLLLLYHSAFSQFQKIEIKDSTLLKAIDLAIDTFQIHGKEPGVLTVEVMRLDILKEEENVKDDKFGSAILIKEKLNYNAKIAFEKNSTWLTYHPPSFYFEYRNRIILLYTGAEKLISIPMSSVRAFSKKLKSHFATDGGTYVSATCWIKVSGDKLVFERKGRS